VLFVTPNAGLSAANFPKPKSIMRLQGF